MPEHVVEPFVGRQEAVRTVSAALTGTGQVGVVIRGRTGMGASRLLDHVVGRHADTVAHVATVRGTTSSDAPYATLLSVLPRDVAEHLDHPVNVVHALSDRFQEEAGGRRALLVVRAGHQVDTLSALVLSSLCLAGTCAVAVVADADTPLPADLADLVDDGLLAEVRLSPFDRDEVHAYLRARLGGRVNPRLVDIVHAGTGGVPARLGQLAEEALRNGTIRLFRGVWVASAGGPLPARDPLPGALPRSGEPGRDVLETVALAPGIAAERLHDLADPHVVDALLDAHLVVRPAGSDGSATVHVTDPRLAQRLRSQVPGGRRRQLLRSVFPDGAEPGDDHVLLYARWAVDCGEPVRDDVIVAAANRALGHLDPDLALRLLATVPAAGRSPYHEALTAIALAATGRSDEARPHVVEAVARASSRSDAVAVAGQLDAFGDVDTAPARPDEEERPDVVVEAVLALARGGDVDVKLLESEAAHEAARLVADGVAHSGATTTSAAITPSTAAVPMTWRAAEAVAATGRLGDAIGLMRLVAPGRPRLLDEQGRGLAACFGVLVLGGDLASARAALDVVAGPTAAAPAAPSGDDPLVETLADLAQALLAIEDGRDDDARRLLAGVKATLTDRDVPGLLPLVRAALAYVLALQGDHEDARDVLAGLGGDRTGVSARLTIRRLTDLYALRAGLALGDRGALDELVATARGDVDSGRPGLTPRPVLVAALERHPGALDLLPAVAAVVETPLRPVLRGLRTALDGRDVAALLALADLAADQGEVATARAVARLAEAVAREDSGPRHTRRIRGEVAARPWIGRQRDPRAGSDGLTVREREVCALVADGLTNQEIAARLHLSVRTVEGYVSSAYAKLQVAHRGDLARYFR